MKKLYLCYCNSWTYIWELAGIQVFRPRRNHPKVFKYQSKIWQERNFESWLPSRNALLC